MVTPTTRCQIKWLEPSPLWGDQSRWVRLPEQGQITNPMILRFANDNFMDEILAMLDQSPYRLAEWEAQPETWREPMPSPNPVFKIRPNAAQKKLYNGRKLILNNPAPAVKNQLNPNIDMAQGFRPSADQLSAIKLFQPAQNRYYLVAASLIAEQEGYPDYPLDLGHNERATFVVRALVTDQDQAKNGEYAYVTTPGGKVWKKVSSHGVTHFENQHLIPNEEQLPLFPLHYPDRCDRRRQVLAGFIPVGKREEWLGAAQSGRGHQKEMINPVPSTEDDSQILKEIFYADVVEPWRALIEQAQNIKGSLRIDQNTFPNFTDQWNAAQVAIDAARSLRAARDQIQTGSWYILLDFANFIERHLPNVWGHLVAESPAPRIDPAERKFIDEMKNMKLSADFFAALAIDHFSAAQNTISANTLWEELTVLWKLEDKLQLARWPKRVRNLPRAIVNRINGEEFDRQDRERFQKILSLIRTGRWYTLLDMAAYLGANVPNLKRRALGKIAERRLSADEKAAKKRLSNLKKNDLSLLVSAIGVADLSRTRMTIASSLADALVAVRAHQQALNSLTAQFDRSAPPPDAVRTPVIDPLWPDFLFPLADPDTTLAMTRSVVVPTISVNTRGLNGVEIAVARLNALADRVDALLPAPSIAPERQTDIGPTPLLNHQSARFVIRCVFERPDCGPLFTALVSKATRQIELAPFFDPDAPARPVRIALPMDISPASLRKYKKNAVFLISDMLCGKISNIKKMTLADLVLSVLPWPFHKDLPSPEPAGPCKSTEASLGMFCSLSIPIVTLCALILMIIMVQLFDFVFRWIPYLFVCLPIPGFKGKDNDGS